MFSPFRVWHCLPIKLSNQLVPNERPLSWMASMGALFYEAYRTYLYPLGICILYRGYRRYQQS